MVRRRPHGEPPAGARCGAPRHGSRALRADRHDGATRSRSRCTCARTATSSRRSAASHVATTEVMTSAALSGIAFRTVDPGPRGWIDADQARDLLEPDTYYDVEVVDLLSVENTLGGTGGRVMPARRAASRAEGRRRGRRCRCTSTGPGCSTPPPRRRCRREEFAREADTVMFCVSKGLGAPIGSLLCGPAELMPEARRLWILFGGAWRQAGITAAAGIVALQRGPERLHEDHERARRLADGVADRLPGSVDLDQVETNMVLVDTEAVGARRARDRGAPRGSRRGRHPHRHPRAHGDPRRRDRRGGRRRLARVGLDREGRSSLELRRAGAGGSARRQVPERRDLLRVRLGVARRLEHERPVSRLGSAEDRPPARRSHEALADRRVAVAAFPARERRVVRMHERDPVGEAGGVELVEERRDPVGSIERVAGGEEVTDVEAESDPLVGRSRRAARPPPRRSRRPCRGVPAISSTATRTSAATSSTPRRVAAARRRATEGSVVSGGAGMHHEHVDAEPIACLRRRPQRATGFARGSQRSGRRCSRRTAHAPPAGRGRSPPMRRGTAPPCRRRAPAAPRLAGSTGRSGRSPRRGGGTPRAPRSWPRTHGAHGRRTSQAGRAGSRRRSSP